jgi:hypothetical protein
MMIDIDLETGDIVTFPYRASLSCDMEDPFLKYYNVPALARNLFNTGEL